ncbi:hypothetical protein PAECIP111893_02352 [Paenibacillus plantiphilus]|uniref:ABC transporter substrate-binding protein n=1 Tax=Paenibacillus plantiphilus TaxID=2905650 RepID=A0ABM9C8T9_9BACL|nr:extracellular solute-binding protein [Paenibacillus plantiphilus]CAH1205457.1 hypothetical protein PAECIP111893_02352 [Paenibacillus plantiphilus]
MRTYLSICLTIVLIVLQSGCISKSKLAEDNVRSEDKEVLTVYLNDFDDIIGPMFEEATGYRIELVQGSGAELMSRIEAERGNPHWDVVWADLISSIHGLGLNGMFYEGFVPEHAAKLKETYKLLVPEGNWYYPTGAHAAAVITYNNDVLTTEEAPASWTDFSNPAFKSSVGIADPAIAAPAYAFVSSFFQQYDIEGGKAIISDWFDNGLLIYPKNPNLAMALLSGQIKVAALQESNAYNLVNQNKPVSIIWPAEGAPAAVRVAAISKETKQLEAAKAFVNFLLDPAIQQAIIDASEESYHEPSVVGVQPKSDRELNAKLLFPDIMQSYQHEAEIKQWFADFSIK